MMCVCVCLELQSKFFFFFVYLSLIYICHQNTTFCLINNNLINILGQMMLVCFRLSLFPGPAAGLEAVMSSCPNTDSSAAGVLYRLQPNSDEHTDACSQHTQIGTHICANAIRLFLPILSYIQSPHLSSCHHW